MDEVDTVDGSDDAMLLNVNDVDLNDEEILRLHESDLERLKDAMTVPLSPS